MTNLQSKLRQAKLATAKKIKEKEVAQEVIKSDIGELYKQLDLMYSQVATALNEIREHADKVDVAHEESLTKLNNTIVGLMTTFTEKIGTINELKEVKVSNITEAKQPQPKIVIPDSVTIKNIEQLSDKGYIEEANKSLANIAEQLGQLEDLKQGQKPSDFTPFRRVIKVGNRLQFDDSSWSKGGGGGTQFDKTGLATEAKQDEVITAIEGIDIAPDTPLSKYSYIQKDTSGATYKYYGYADANTAGGWAIKRITIATNLAEFVVGASDYSTAWGDRATQTYADIWSTF